VLTAPLSAASTLSLAGLATSAEASLIGLEPPGNPRPRPVLRRGGPRCPSSFLVFTEASSHR
jgi:hypothetical protein